MRTRLLNEGNEDLVLHVLDFMLNVEQVKIISTLYDGSSHIQTVGRPTKSAEISVRATQVQKDILNLKEASAELLVLFREGITYKGIIKEAIKWKENVPRRVYEGAFTFLINEVIE